MARHPRWVRRAFAEEDLAAMTEAIAAAERQTSAEIRVHLEDRLPRGAADDALARAREVFTRLGMQQTAQRNGVLIYLALADHHLAIVGDEGIHGRVGDGYWQRVRDLMVERLHAGRARDAVVDAVAEVGRVLTTHFPRRPDDVNELSDRVSLN